MFGERRPASTRTGAVFAVLRYCRFDTRARLLSVIRCAGFLRLGCESLIELSAANGRGETALFTNLRLIPLFVRLGHWLQSSAGRAMMQPRLACQPKLP